MADGWEPWAAAAFAPVAVWVLWRLQTLSVEALRLQLVKLARYPSQKWLYAIVSWLGVVVHEVSHASVLLLSGHGIKEFRAGMETGHVMPTRMRKGVVPTLFFLVAALAPLFIPPILALAALLWVTEGALVPWQVPMEGLEPAARAVADLATDLPVRLLKAVANLDLADPWHLGCFALILLAMPSSRPSHVKGSRFHGTQDEGDVAVLRERLRKNPLPFLLFVAALYGAYFALVPWWPKGYWYGFEAVWAVAMTGIALALFGAAWWTLAVLDGRVTPMLGWLGFAAFVAAQAALRAVPALGDLGWPLWQVNAASVAAWLAVSLALATVAPRRSRRPF